MHNLNIVVFFLKKKRPPHSVAFYLGKEHKRSLMESSHRLASREIPTAQHRSSMVGPRHGGTTAWRSSSIQGHPQKSTIRMLKDMLFNVKVNFCVLKVFLKF